MAELHPTRLPGFRDDYEHVLVRRAGHVLEITINRPEQRNALTPPANDELQACSIETAWGAKLDGEMLDFDAAGGCLRFRVNARSPTATITFSRLRKLLLTVPLKPAPKMPGAARRLS